MPFFYSCQKGDKIPLWSWGNRVDLVRGHESALPWWDRCEMSLSPVLVIFGPPGDSNECLVFIITRCHFPVASVLVWCNVTRKRHGHCQNYQPSFHHVYLFFCCSSDTFRRLRMFCDVIRDLVSGFLFLMSGLIRSDRSMQLIFFAFWKIMPATKCGNNKMSVWRSRLGAE